MNVHACDAARLCGEMFPELFGKAINHVQLGGLGWSQRRAHEACVTDLPVHEDAASQLPAKEARADQSDC